MHTIHPVCTITATSQLSFHRDPIHLSSSCSASKSSQKRCPMHKEGGPWICSDLEGANPSDLITCPPLAASIPSDSHRGTLFFQKKSLLFTLLPSDGQCTGLFHLSHPFQRVTSHYNSCPLQTARAPPVSAPFNLTESAKPSSRWKLTEHKSAPRRLATGNTGSVHVLKHKALRIVFLAS